MCTIGVVQEHMGPCRCSFGAVGGSLEKGRRRRDWSNERLRREPHRLSRRSGSCGATCLPRSVLNGPGLTASTPAAAASSSAPHQFRGDMLVNPAVHPPLQTQLPPNGIAKVEKASWAVEAAAKKAAQSALIPSAWRLPSTLLDTLPLDVRPVVAACGLLTARQVTITEIDEASVILTRLRNGEYSAVEVAEAFCLRAAIAHQLVRTPDHTYRRSYT